MQPSDHGALSLRQRFSTKEIADAYRNHDCSYAKAAKALTGLGRGTVSRQVMRHWVMALDDTELPGEASHAAEVLRTRNQQVSNNKLRKDVRELTEYIENHLLARDAIADACSTIKKRKKTRPHKATTKGKPVTVELLLSDLQIGKLSAAYNTPTAYARLREYTRAALHQISQKQQAGYRVERIVLGLLGDIIESDKKHKNSARATDTGTAEQMHNAIVGLFVEVIEPLASLGVPVDVVCVTGNHDHDDHGLLMYKPGTEQLSYPLYRSLEFIAQRSGYDNVEFDIPEGSFALVQFYGQLALYEHGVGVSVSESAMKTHKVKRSEQVEQHLTYFRMGDKHTVTTFNSGQHVINGAFFGTDKRGIEYSGIAGFNSIPAQWMGFHCPREDSRYTLYDSFTIQLGHIVEE